MSSNFSICCAIRNYKADPWLGRAVATWVMEIHMQEIDWDSNETMMQIRDVFTIYSKGMAIMKVAITNVAPVFGRKALWPRML